MSHPVSQFDAELGEFLQLAGTLWRHYQSVGPGKVDSILFDRLDLSAKRLTRLLDSVANAEDIAKALQKDDATRLSELVAAIHEVLRLAKRCACSPQGLSFVTGEAGLVPNKQQHRELESQLAKLGQLQVWLRQLSRAENA